MGQPSKESKAKWREKKREEIRAKARENRKINGDRLRAAEARWRDRNREAVRRNGRKQWYKRYGITEEVYEALLEKQNGVCYICLTKKDGKYLCVDHCHASGAVRGLLCRNCNVGLGLFYDKPELLERATMYLKQQESVS